MFDLLQHIDEGVFLFVNQSASALWLDPWMIAFSSKWLWIPFYLVIIWLFYKRFGKKLWIPILLCLIAFGLSDSISTRVFKQGVKRERPFLNEKLNARLPDGPAGSKYGFVSSHSANMFALVTMLLLTLQWSRKKVLIPVFFASLIAYSRVYLGVHYPLDVICGAILGVLLAYLVFYLSQRIPHLKLV